MAKCLHQSIKIVTNSYYKVDIGWEALQELPDIDMGDYFIQEESNRVVCEDCAEVLEE